VAASRPDGARILVVDDSEASRYITASWLRRSGYTVTEALTGSQALAAVGEHDFDVVMLDVHLPDMSGFEVCERIKADPRTAGVPVIHLSSTYVDTQDKAIGLSRGADAYLTEPIDPAELVATVQAALRYYRARATAERLAERLTRLTEATFAINASTGFDALLRAAVTGAAAVLSGSSTALVLTPDGRLRSGHVAGPDNPVVLRTVPAALVQQLASVLGDGVGAEIAVLDDPPWSAGGAQTVVVARTKSGRPPICLAVDAAAATAQDDRNLLLQLGQAMALATEALRLYTEEHTLALTLQRSLLPNPNQLPNRPELPMAVRYVPASDNAEIGGDFYEVTELDGKLLVAIGDVCGHSIEAATIMGEVRHALRAYAVEGHDLVEILRLLDVMLRRFHDGWLTTMCLLLVDLAAGTVTVANAGHVPPLLADPSGARYLDVPGPLLGVDLDRPPATELTLDRGTLVVLMTDGLIEGRRLLLDDGMEMLRASVSHDEELEPLCDRLLAQFGQGKQDDIALIALRYRP
jgi:serine phosphatase RsbU (regulator of sigma subunit)/DNA-binding NarL/FixJ family response regulator